VPKLSSEYRGLSCANAGTQDKRQVAKISRLLLLIIISLGQVGKGFERCGGLFCVVGRSLDAPLASKAATALAIASFRKETPNRETFPQNDLKSLNNILRIETPCSGKQNEKASVQ